MLERIFSKSTLKQHQHSNTGTVYSWAVMDLSFGKVFTATTLLWPWWVLWYSWVVKTGGKRCWVRRSVVRYSSSLYDVSLYGEHQHRYVDELCMFWCSEYNHRDVGHSMFYDSVLYCDNARDIERWPWGCGWYENEEQRRRESRRIQSMSNNMWQRSLN